MRQTFNHPVAFASACAVALVLALAGCGGGSGGGASTSSVGPPLSPPKAKESIDQAKARFQHAFASGDCKKIAKLNLIGPRQAAPTTKRRCQVLTLLGKRLSSYPVTGADAYGGGGVIDYRAGTGATARTIAAVLILDSDGLYHLAFVDPYQAAPSAGTKFAPAFDDAAKAAATALSQRDCQAYLAVAYRRAGIGSLSKSEACKAIDRNVFYLTKKRFPTIAPPRRLGGNHNYAFYSYGTPSVGYTMLMVRQSDQGLPKGFPTLPSGSAEYSYYGTFRTSSKAPANQSTP